MKYSVSIIALAFAATLISGSFAHAQNRVALLVRDDEDTRASFSRTPRDLNLTPKHYQGLLIEPSLTVTGEYNDNVFLTDSDSESDLVVETAPRLRLTKAIRDHSAVLDIEARDRQFLDLSSEDSTSYSAALALKLQARKNFALPFTFKVSRQDIDRTHSVNTPTARISQFDSYSFSGGADYQFNRLNLKLIGSYAARDFEDSSDTLTGLPVIFSLNDRDEASLSLVGTYDLLGNHGTQRGGEHSLFAGISVTQQDFDRFDSGGGDTSDLRSNNSINILAGLRTRYKDLLIGDIGIGYIRQDFDSDLSEDVNSYDISADLDYLITPRLTLNFEAAREVSQDNDVVQGVLRSRYLLGAEYEFAHDLYGRMYT